MPSGPEIVDSRSNDGITVKLIKGTGVLGEDDWSVVLSDSSGFITTPCWDEYQAITKFRLLCNEIGIQMPYEAPRFETPVVVSADPVQDAAAIYYTYHGRLGKAYPGSDAAHAIQSEMMADPEFQKNAQDILALTPDKTSNWIIASIRVCCKRVTTKQRAEQERELEALPNFGGF